MTSEYSFLRASKNYPQGARLEKIVIGEEPAIGAAGHVAGIAELADETHLGFPAKITKTGEIAPAYASTISWVLSVEAPSKTTISTSPRSPARRCFPESRL